MIGSIDILPDARIVLAAIGISVVYLAWLSWSQRSVVPLLWIVASALFAGVAHFGVHEYFDTLYAMATGAKPESKPEMLDRLWPVAFALHLTLAMLLLLYRGGTPFGRRKPDDDATVIHHGEF